MTFQYGSRHGGCGVHTGAMCGAGAVVVSIERRGRGRLTLGYAHIHRKRDLARRDVASS